MGKDRDNRLSLVNLCYRLEYDVGVSMSDGHSHGVSSSRRARSGEGSLDERHGRPLLVLGQARERVEQ